MAGDGLAIDVDPVRAGIEGLTPADVASQMETYLAETLATEVQKEDRTIGVRLWVPRRIRSSIQDLKHVLIAAPDGHKVALSRIADLACADRTARNRSRQPEDDGRRHGPY